MSSRFTEPGISWDTERRKEPMEQFIRDGGWEEEKGKIA